MRSMTRQTRLFNAHGTIAKRIHISGFHRPPLG